MLCGVSDPILICAAAGGESPQNTTEVIGIPEGFLPSDVFAYTLRVQTPPEKVQETLKTTPDVFEPFWTLRDS